MKVRMLVTMSGTRNGKEWPARGNPIELPDDEAQQLIAQSMAIPCTDMVGDVETATLPDEAVEHRVAPAVTEKPLTTKTGPGPVGRGKR